MTSYTILKTPLMGDLLLVANETQLTGIYYAGGKHAPGVNKAWKRDPAHPVLKKAGREIEDYLKGKRDRFTVPLHADGTDFQRAVWREIARIPFGKTISYSELARRAGKPDAIRAAGTATGRNPHSIIVPCHRVLAKGGGLGGYAGTLARKKRLLAIEKVLGTVSK
jgi:methylated-DNA-[protein]-cysteine S-methyltransferase